MEVLSALGGNTFARFQINGKLISVESFQFIMLLIFSQQVVELCLDFSQFFELDFLLASDYIFHTFQVLFFHHHLKILRISIFPQAFEGDLFHLMLIRKYFSALDAPDLEAAIMATRIDSSFR